MSNYTRNPSSVKTEPPVKVSEKRFNKLLFVVIKFFVFAFPLNRMPLFGFGPILGYKFSFLSSLKRVRV